MTPLLFADLPASDHGVPAGETVLAASLAVLAVVLLWVVIARLWPKRATPRERLPGEMTKGLAAKELEFLPAALELLETPPSPVRIAGMWVICAAFAVALIWSYIGKLDIHAVAQGRVQPSGRSKVIQPLEPGKVVAVRVENGTPVKAGDVLIELDPTESGADREAQVRDLDSARGEAARRRLAIEIASEPDGKLEMRQITFDATVSDDVRHREEVVLVGDLIQLRASRASLEAQYAEKVATREKLKNSTTAREKVLALAKERVDMRSELNDRGSLSRAMVIEVLSQYEQLVMSQVSDQGQLIETEAQLGTIARKKEETLSSFVAEQSQKLAEAERKADRLSQELVKATAKNDRATLKAPIDGIVQQLAVTTVGQVVGSGQSLMTIVPSDGPIEIEAHVLNQDIGFVKPGQEAVIKVEAFTFTRYGTLPGRIIKVSREAIEEREAMGLADPATAVRGAGANAGNSSPRQQNLVFPAIIQLDQRTIDVDGEAIPLRPGMSVSVEILTGQRRAIDYVLSPLRETASKTARER